MTDDEALPDPPDELVESIRKQASELGLTDPTIEDGFLMVWLDETRLFKVFADEEMAFFVVPLWPVTLIGLDELQLLNEAVESSDFAIEVTAFRDEDPRSEPEFWYCAIAEIPAGAAVDVSENVLSDSLGVIEESEERNGTLADKYHNQLNGAMVAAASIEMAAAIKDQEDDRDRAKRMKVVIAEKELALVDTYADFLDPDSDAPPIRELLAEATEEEGVLILLECAFLDPFAPYDIPISDDDRRIGLEKVGTAIGFVDSEDAVDQLLEIKELELGKQSALRDPKTAGAIAATATAATVAFGALVMATGGAAALGGLGPLGLAGAAATTHGLALLGGGSLAAGGMGMAGGMWIIGGAGVLSAGSAVAAGGLSVLALTGGPEVARIELVKLQTTCAWIYYGDGDSEKIAAALEALAASAEATSEDLEKERATSDPDSSRIKNLEKTLTYIQRASESVASDEYDSKDRAFGFAVRSQEKFGLFTRRAKRAFS